MSLALANTPYRTHDGHLRCTCGVYANDGAALGCYIDHAQQREYALDEVLNDIGGPGAWGEFTEINCDLSSEETVQFYRGLGLIIRNDPIAGAQLIQQALKRELETRVSKLTGELA